MLTKYCPHRPTRRLHRFQSSTLSPPPHNAFYSPYTGTPFVPPPMAPPGSYYMPTVQLPDSGPPAGPPPSHPPGPQHHPPGVSADWIGPQAGQPAAYGTPYGAFGAYAQPLPPTNPHLAPGPYGPPPPAHPPHGFAPQYATPAPQFAMPPGYPPMAYATPAWVPAPMAYAAPGPPPPAAPPRQPERLTRAERYDKIGHFAAGPHCMRRACSHDIISTYPVCYLYRWPRARTNPDQGCRREVGDQPFAPSYRRRRRATAPPLEHAVLHRALPPLD